MPMTPEELKAMMLTQAGAPDAATEGTEPPAAPDENEGPVDLAAMKKKKKPSRRQKIKNFLKKKKLKE